MTIGTGIAVAAVWVFAAVCAVAKSVTGHGLSLGMGVALAATAILASCTP